MHNQNIEKPIGHRLAVLGLVKNNRLESRLRSFCVLCSGRCVGDEALRLCRVSCLAARSISHAQSLIQRSFFIFSERVLQMGSQHVLHQGQTADGKVASTKRV